MICVFGKLTLSFISVGIVNYNKVQDKMLYKDKYGNEKQVYFVFRIYNNKSLRDLSNNHIKNHQE